MGADSFGGVLAHQQVNLHQNPVTGRNLLTDPKFSKNFFDILFKKLIPVVFSFHSIQVIPKILLHYNRSPLSLNYKPGSAKKHESGPAITSYK